MKGKKNNTIIRLSVNTSVLDSQYGFDKSPISNTTKIKDLENTDLSLYNDMKDQYQVKVSSISFNKTNICFWDRCEFSNPPVYCPVQMKYATNVKEYTSTINSKLYKIQDTINIDGKQEFFVDGIFCSLECCLAFIIDNSHNIMYKDSETLLKYIYNCNKINPAPNWRLLEKYGGNMSIEQFRKSFMNISYELDGTFFLPIYMLYRENYHL